MEKIMCFISLVFISVIANGQSANEDSLKLAVKLYASFRGHFAFYNDEIEIQENASRIGFEVSVYKGIAKFFSGAEFKINVFKSPTSFNVDGNTNSGFIKLNDPQFQQVFSARLGYLGVDFGKFGRVAIGKQWSVYYDITGFTDKFNVFGVRGSATYLGNSDGGESGTGRASQTCIYRNSYKGLSVAMQFSFQNTVNDKFLDGYGFSVQYEPLDGLRIGAAYNKAFLIERLIENTLGIDGQPQYFSVGLNYSSDIWDLGLVYARETNGDLTEVPVDDELVAAVYDAEGVEVSIKFKQAFYTILAGYNAYRPNTDEIPVNPNFNRKFFILGAEYKPFNMALVYAEYRLSYSIDQFGFEEYDVITLGLKLDLQHIWNAKIRN